MIEQVFHKLEVADFVLVGAGGGLPRDRLPLDVDGGVERRQPIGCGEVGIRTVVGEILRDDIIMPVRNGDHKRRTLIAGADRIHVGTRFHEHADGIFLVVARGEVQGRHATHDAGRATILAAIVRRQLIAVVVNGHFGQFNHVAGCVEIGAVRRASSGITASRFRPAANINAVWWCDVSFTFTSAP